jgi:hypothetical protein
LIGCLIGGVVFASIGCLAALAFGAYVLYDVAGDEFPAVLDDLSSNLTPTNTPQLVFVTPAANDGGSLDPSAYQETLDILENTIIPENDPAELAVRLLGVDSVPLTHPDPDAPYAIGAEKSFWIINTSTNQSSQVDAVLRYETPHVYFWIEEDVSYNQTELATLVETFENEIYPTTRAFFGSEWAPGIDEDPHIYILYTPGIGFGTAGYFSSSDSVHPLAHEYSNAHEMFVFNADNSPLGSSYTIGVLAHEFQHMIHWNGDRNESSWINEGFSEVAMLLNGYDPGGFDYVYISDPDWQLNNWDPDGNTSANYGSAFLFLTYFLDRFGQEITQALVAHPENDLKSIDAVLSEHGITDPLTNEAILADDVVIDWAVTNYLLDDSVGDGRYTYNLYSEAPQAFETETIRDCEGAAELRDVAQYGVDYIRINCTGEYTLHFNGSQLAGLLPESAYSGETFFWSNKGDESDMTLTRQFDFSGHTGSLTLSYYTWYDLEADYDYLYLMASTDGETWDILTTPSGTSLDPSGNSYGWAYNGQSNGWILETVDISNYAGGEVWLRFEYITDAAVNGEGFMLDDIAITEIGYFTDFESDAGGWENAGWVRVTNQLPQTFRLALISVGDETTVDYLALDDNNELNLAVDIGGEVDEIVLVVVGTTRHTRQRAAYQFEVIPAE